MAVDIDREFGEDCGRIWRVLVDRAIQRRPITYKCLSGATGIRFGLIARNSGRLGAIYDYCLHRDLPPLCVLVIRKRQKTPGRGDPGTAIEGETRQVFDYDWQSIPAPESRDF